MVKIPIELCQFSRIILLLILMEGSSIICPHYAEWHPEWDIQINIFQFGLNRQ